MGNDIPALLDISQMSLDCADDEPGPSGSQHPTSSTPKKGKQNVDIYDFEDSDNEEVNAPMSPLQLEEDESSWMAVVTFPLTCYLVMKSP